MAQWYRLLRGLQQTFSRIFRPAEPGPDHVDLNLRKSDMPAQDFNQGVMPDYQQALQRQGYQDRVIRPARSRGAP